MLSLRKQRVLIISPHPDDEVIGCGGLIKRAKEEGGEVYVLFVTVGTTEDYSQTGISTVGERIKEIKEVATFLNYDGYHIAFPGNDFHLRLDQVSQKELINEIERGKSGINLNNLKPTIVVSPSLSQYNQDHRALSWAVHAACRPMPDDYKPLQRVILAYEHPTDAWTQFPNHPFNTFVEMKPTHLEAKVEALKIYQSQVREGTHLRSIEALKQLASLRGRQAGLFAAEAFFAYRVIV